MADLNFSMRIGVEDGTESGLQSAMSRVKKFFAGLAGKAFAMPFNLGKAGLGMLRDINLGLMPLARGLDSIIERGSSLGVVEKAFSSLTRTFGSDTDNLARSLQDASSGTLSLRRSMELANRAIAANIDASRDLPDILEFASKKAISTGTSFEVAAEQLITGLSRGSAAFLDNFGILNDGIEGVRRTYDEMQGAGAFDDLGPAGQKAELIRQAMTQIRQQMRGLGVTGREAAFQFARMKSSVTDALDRFMSAIAGSRAMREALTGVSDVLQGIGDHLRRDGSSFWDVITGKGRSSGIFGILSGVLEDVADLFVAKLSAGLRQVADTLTDEITSAIDALAAKFQSLTSWLPGFGSGGAAGDTPGAADGWWSRVTRWAADQLFPPPGTVLGFDSYRPSTQAGEMVDDAKAMAAFPATRRRVDEFLTEFGTRKDARGRTVAPWILDRQRDAPLTDKGLADRAGERNLLNRSIAVTEAQAARDARRQAAGEVAEMRRRGFDIDREIAERQIRERLIEQRTRGMRARLLEIEQEEERTFEWERRRAAAKRQAAPGGRVAARPPDFNNMPDDTGAAMYVEEGVALIRQLVEIGNGLLAVLGGGDRQLAAVGGGRA